MERALYHAPLLLPYIALFVLVRAWFKPGLIAGEDFHPLDWSGQVMLQHHYLPWPGSWNGSVDLGLPTEFWMPMNPLLFVAGVLSHLGASWAVIERVLFLLPLFVLLVLAPYLLGFRLTHSPWAASGGALVFAINTWVVGLIERGHIPALMGYALMPLALLFVTSAIRLRSRRDTFCFALVVLVQGTYEIRYAYLTVIAAGVVAVSQILARPRTYFTIASLKLAAFALAIIIVGSLYWVLPMLLSPVALPSGYGGLHEFISTNAKMTLLGSVSLFYPFYHHIVSNNGFFHDPVEWPFVLIGLLAAFGLLLGHTRAWLRALTLLWIGGVVFASGSLGFFGPLNQWIFTHVPGMSAFRDSTKLFAYANLAAASGIAMILFRAPNAPYVNRFIQRRTARIIATALFISFYLFAIRDAYNPLRLSNFARVQVSAADVQLQRYLNDASAGKVLYFPSYPYGYVNNGRHAAVEAGYLVQPNWSLMGLGALNPDPGNMLAFYASPLAPSLMCETGIRYVAIDTDTEGMYYEPWQYPIQRGEATAFFDSRPWLKRIDYGMAQLPVGQRPILYRVTGCDTAANRLAFVARLPLLFNGSDPYVQGLAGTQFWQNDPAVLLATQQRTLTPYDIVQNVISAPLSVSPEDVDATDYALPADRQSALVAEASRRVRYDPWAYHGFALNARAEAEEVGSPFPPGIIKGAFVSQAGPAKIEAVVAPHYARTQIATIVRALRPAPRRGSMALLVDPLAFDVQSLSGVSNAPIANGSGWLQVNQGGAYFAIVNPLPRPVIADVVFPGAVALSGAGQVYTVSVDGKQSWSTALPAALRSLFHTATSLTVRGVKLMPGSNPVSVRPGSGTSDGAVPSSLAIDGNITVVDPHVLPGEVQSRVLPVSTATTPAGGIRISVNETANVVMPAETRFSIMHSTNVSLAQRPLLTFRYLAPAAPLNFGIAFTLRGPTGNTEFIADLPRGLHEFTIDPFDAIQRALDDQRAQSRAHHQGDFSWLRADAHRPRQEASQYSISSIDLVVSKPAAVDAGSASGTFDSMEMSLPRTSISAPRLEYLAQYDFRSPHAFSPIRTQNVAIVQTINSEHSASLVASLQRMPQEAMPTHLHSGDQAEVTLTTGATIAGVVKSISPEFIVFQQGNAYTGIRRSTIAEIKRLYPKVQQYFSFDIPFVVPASATDLRFHLSVDPAFTPDIRLLVRKTAQSAPVEVFPQDRLAAVAPKATIPSAWLQSRPNEELVDPLDMMSLSSSGPHAAVAQEVAYDIPINAVLSSELPDDAHARIVGLRFTFYGKASDAGGAITSTVRLSNLSATTLSRRASGRMHASIDVDGRHIELVPEGVIDLANGTGSRNVGATILSEGQHELVAREDGAHTVQSVVVSQGRPVAYAGTDVSADDIPSYSERSGMIDTPGGLLVMPTTFASRWHLALAPLSFHPSRDPVLDYFRLRGAFVPADNHVMVNGGLNAWFIPRFRGRLVFIYDGTVYSRIAIVVELLVIAIWALVAWLRRTRTIA